MTMTPLPSFENPPVVETVLGVQFDRLQNLSNAHLGAFWKYLGSEWPSVKDVPPLQETFETFQGEGAWKVLGLRISHDQSHRLQIRNFNNDRMVQVQNNRLHYNWLGQVGGPYPRYNIVKAEFTQVINSFNEFLASEAIGSMSPNQWEVTYVNHIPQGGAWTSPADWSELFCGISGVIKGPPYLALESFGGHWHFEIPPQRGRLHVDIQHGKSNANESIELLTMKLTARGPVSESKSIADGLDLGHEAIVTSFKDLTSSKAHSFWRLKQ